jgi:hypothetical protein
MDNELTVAEVLRRLRELPAERLAEELQTTPPPFPELIERAIRE